MVIQIFRQCGSHCKLKYRLCNANFVAEGLQIFWFENFESKAQIKKQCTPELITIKNNKFFPDWNNSNEIQHTKATLSLALICISIANLSLLIYQRLRDYGQVVDRPADSRL